MVRRIILSVLIFLASVLVLTGAEVEPQSPVPEHCLIRVKLAEGERVWILRSDFAPVDVQFASSERLIVWTGPPGRYAVLTWTDTGQGQEIVEIVKGDGPEPPDPEPPDPDPPDPDPPDPPGPTPDVKNEYGIGQVVYEEALRVGRLNETEAMAAAARSALEALLEGRATPSMAEATLRTVRLAQKGSWGVWETRVEQAMRQAISSHGAGALVYRDYFLEITDGLEEAAKKQRQ